MITKKQKDLILELSKQSQIDFLVWNINEQYFDFKIYFKKQQLHIEKLSFNSSVPVNATGLAVFRVEFVTNYVPYKSESSYINSNNKIYSKISRIYDYMLSLYLININNFKLGNFKTKIFLNKPKVQKKSPKKTKEINNLIL